MTERSTKLVFQDTSVLINLYRGGQLLGLGRALPDALRWVASIRQECRRLERVLDLPGLTETVQDILGEPTRPDGEEHLRIRQLRQQIAKPGDHPDAHLGEAETIVIVESRGLDAVLAFDDADAKFFAQPRPCVTTWEILRLCIRTGEVTESGAWAVRDAFVDAGGYLPKSLKTSEGFAQWLGSDAP